ncbi:MAG TPA: hypothetical protein VF052_09830 [Solirubrobacterales bacterium]
MKKLLSACAVLALAIGLVVAPGAVAKKGPKNVGGTVSVSVAPTTITTETTVTASGNVASNSNCRKDRTVHLYWSGAPTTEVGSATTRSNGNYTATVPAPTTTGQMLLAKVDQVTRKVGSKKKGKKTKKGRPFNCMIINGASAPVTIAT